MQGSLGPLQNEDFLSRLGKAAFPMSRQRRHEISCASAKSCPSAVLKKQPKQQQKAVKVPATISLSFVALVTHSAGQIRML